LERHLTRRPFVRASVRRFMPGERLADAMSAAERLGSEGLASTVTFLGEDVATVGAAEEAAREYELAYGEIAERGVDTEVSLKPTHLGLVVATEVAVTNLGQLATCAAATSNWLWLDMESHAHVDATIDLYERLRERHNNVGICLQAYLHRTRDDLARLLPLEPSVRLVKGAYREPPELLVGGRRRIDAAFKALSVELIERRRNDMRLVLGTHDLDLILDVGRVARGGPGDVEIAMLYGIRSDAQRLLARRGYRVRTLISYGTRWYPWFMRRIAEKPIANTALALRNVVGPSG
jgi:proline dehydrogenase